MPYPLDVQQISARLPVRRVGRQIRLLTETTSTNDEAFQAADQLANDGLTIFAEYQTKGRGRLGRSWLSPRGASILCSVLLFEPDRPAWQGRLVLISAVAVCDAIRATTNLEPVIRWPNDVLVSGRKLGGILVESRATGIWPAQAGHAPISAPMRAFVVGVGINCFQSPAHFPPELRHQATSLEIESGQPICRVELARQLLAELDGWLAESESLDQERLLQAWLDRAEPLGQRVRLEHAGRSYLGTTVQIEPTGALVVELESGSREVFDPATTALVALP
ncbi:MAG: biotin--[acetyl-CoA-carboxylase] ligase [Phycisphaerae bacterium]